MSVDIYKKKIEEYISKKESSKVELDSARGLLAPKTMNKEVKQQQDMISNIGEFVYALRQKRKELKMKRSKQ